MFFHATHKRILLLAGLTVTSASSFASMANTAGAPWDQTVAAGTLDQSVRVFTSGGRGSGGMFHRSKVTRSINGGAVQDYHCIGIATADHVIRKMMTHGQTLDGIEYVGPGGTQFTLNSTIQRIGLGGSDGNDDLGFVGVMVPYSSLTAAQNTYLEGLNGKTLTEATNAMTTATSYGYGRSARYLLNGAGTKIGFVWAPDLEGFAVSMSGVHRSVNHDPVTLANQAYSIYNFSALKWKTSGDAGEGQINSGDSGGMVLSGGNFVGVNSYAVGTIVNGTEEFRYGEDGGANAFTAANITWLTQNAATICAVPEPGTMVALGFGLAALASRRRRRA